jgi:ABC-2 type transport system ATP-binding protein
MIEVRGVTKRYGEKVAVEDLTFTVQPGIVTGFLGPNGAGKSTTMRMILGLDRPSAGTATVSGKQYTDLPAPLHEVGAMLEARAIHTGRSAHNHLLALAQTHGISSKRVDEVLDIVGLTQVAKKRVGSFSLGMGQRLGIAAALLGDPHTVILDEPANGLDPEGIRWIRNLLMDLARDGRTVFLSSHLMSEIQQSAEHLIVIGKGRLIQDTTVADFVAHASTGAPVRVRGADPTALRDALVAAGPAIIEPDDGGALKVSGLSSEQIGEIAATEGLVLYELTPLKVTLEEAFMSLTHDAVEYQPDASGAGASA